MSTAAGPGSTGATGGPRVPDPERRKRRVQRAMGGFAFEVTPASARKLFQELTEPGSFKEKTLDLLRKCGKGSGCPGSVVHRPRVYVANLPSGNRAELVETIKMVREFGGLDPVIHLPARGFKDLQDVDSFLQEVRPAEHVLVVGGSQAEPVGPFSSALELLETGILQKHAVKTVGLAAHIQEADGIPYPTLEKSFGEKLRWAKRVMGEEDGNVRGTLEESGEPAFHHISWITQLEYLPQNIIDWERGTRTRDSSAGEAAGESGGVQQIPNNLPIQVGVPGPGFNREELAKWAKMSQVSGAELPEEERIQACADDLIGECADYMEKEGRLPREAVISWRTKLNRYASLSNFGVSYIRRAMCDFPNF